MALGLNLANTEYGVTFPDAYARIVTAAVSRQNKGSVVKHNVMIDIAIYANQSAADMDYPKEVAFERLYVDYAALPASTDLLTACYQWLVTQDKFVGATDAQVDYVVNTTGVLVPQAVTMRQARLQLLAVGLLDDVNTMLAADQAAMINWEYATHVYRNDVIVVQLKNSTGMTDEQLDELFVAASKL